MKTLLFTLLFSLSALATTETALENNEFQIPYANSSNVDVDFDKCSKGYYTPVITVEYYHTAFGEWYYERFPIELTDYKLVREGKELYMVNGDEKYLMARKKGFIITWWKIDPSFEFVIDQEFTWKETTYTVKLYNHND